MNNSIKNKDQDKLLEKYNDLKNQLNRLKDFAKPVYEFSDFGNYPHLMDVVKTMQIKIAECQDFYDE